MKTLPAFIPAFFFLLSLQLYFLLCQSFSLAPYNEKITKNHGNFRHSVGPPNILQPTIFSLEPNKQYGQLQKTKRFGLPSESASEEAKQIDGLDYEMSLLRWGASFLSAVAFGVGVYFFKGAQSSLDFFSGYLVEQSLSVDNLFVFLLLFDFFKVELAPQNKVLSYGIFGSVVLRFIFILLGAEALEFFTPVLLGFAGLLLFSSFKILQEWASDDDEEEDDLSENSIVQFSQSLIPSTDYYDGDKFFTMEDGIRKATPLFICLISVELSDIAFAVDSVPAVFGVTRDPFIVFTSNIFAILGLRSLFTILSKAVTDLPYLEPAVAIVLGFVGVKLTASYFGFEVDSGISLEVILACLGGGIGLSLLKKGAKQAEEV
eukprot:CAMPEP_0117755346 /NCGR_PEP_ID=MMETSP0947-20121206/13395_1 /TAXON_ID=44440 /ORGANISM="Chattonella subsalsa, Strain CCMP2191" /LENGTH=374 /DNA_ID=CAMNT_0005574659 /DNA_START=63 /DNA_END=1187 /DNA_ORIENTATION=+